MRTVLGKHIKLSTYPVIEILLKAISGWFSRPFVVKFFVISIISFEEIIEKKFLSIELSKNRVESCRFLLKAVVTCMNNYKFLRNFTTDRRQWGVQQTTTFYEKVLGLERICR